jgi:hypothetical protein
MKEQIPMKRNTNHNSTGPRTPEGKQRSCLNAFRHGLTGQTVVMFPEDRKLFDAFCRGFLNDYQPVGNMEIQLVQNVATCWWRLNRIAAEEQSLLSIETDACEDQINTPDARARTACAAAKAFEMQIKKLANYTLYEQRIAKRCESYFKQLKELQAARKRELRHDLQKATVLKEHHDELQATEPQPVPYNPANDGFVFSTGVLQTRIDRTSRYVDALAAQYDRELLEEDAAA